MDWLGSGLVAFMGVPQVGYLPPHTQLLVRGIHPPQQLHLHKLDSLALAPALALARSLPCPFFLALALVLALFSLLFPGVPWPYFSSRGQLQVLGRIDPHQLQ